MDLKTEITKTVFETYVPAAKMPERNTSVFERLEASFQTAYFMMVRNLVSPEFEADIDDNANLKSLAIPLVCIDGFVRTCRTLDLVLTATGFGIVSTESTAPASKSRVDALIEELSLQELYLIDEMIQELIKVDGWGQTEQAKNSIPTFFYRPQQLKTLCGKVLTTQTWQFAKGCAVTASALLCNEISEEYMDELLEKLRTGSTNNADVIIINKCLRFMADFISNYEQTKGCPNEAMLRQIVHQLESYRDSYPTYCSSKLYASRHAERYQNKKEDPTFFFM
ncbi:MAG: hypothetical protein K6F02_00995 [Prevotella sp.]|nr:hypothetical protein [Prevotella sp.]